MRAVHAKGSGALTGVRVIKFAEDSLFWFEVDSQYSAVPTAGVPQNAVEQEPQLPSWALSNQPIFPWGPPVPKVDDDRQADESPTSSSGIGVGVCMTDHSEELRLKARCWDQRF